MLQNKIMKLQIPLLSMISTCLWISYRVLRLKGSNKINLIMAHGVYNNSDQYLARPFHSMLSLKSLEGNIKALKKTHTFISIDECVRMISGEVAFRPRCVVLTFDDSLSCFSEIVAPALRRLKVPAIFYISTKAIEERQVYWWLRLDYLAFHCKDNNLAFKLPNGKRYYLNSAQTSTGMRELKTALKSFSVQEIEGLIFDIEKKANIALDNSVPEYQLVAPMSWWNVRKLVYYGMAIGSHSVTHPNMKNLDYDEIRFELVKSRKIIEENIGVTCEHFAYPGGFVPDFITNELHEFGYKSAVTTQSPGFNKAGDNLVKLRRHSMPRVTPKLPYLVSGMKQGVNNLK